MSCTNVSECRQAATVPRNGANSIRRGERMRLPRTASAGIVSTAPCAARNNREHGCAPSVSERFTRDDGPGGLSRVPPDPKRGAAFEGDLDRLVALLGDKAAI